MQETRRGDEQPDQPELVTIGTAQGLPKAHVIKAKLEEAGIPVLLEYESVGPVIGITADGLGEVRIRVPTQYARRARALIMVR
jgi:hypothetical protein